MHKKYSEDLKKAISTTLAIIIAVIIIIAIVAGVAVVLSSHKPSPVTTTITSTVSTFTTVTTTVSSTVTTTTSSSTTSVTKATVTISPPNTSQLVDVYWTETPDALDPATGFSVVDGPLYAAVYQELVEFNGSSITSIVPVIAQNYSTSNYENWTFYIRQGVHFADGVQVNAS
ncbi:MAG: ABC transporter substrate-binding protein, partial [Sulfolobaceae archaeon]|nr:ABC transporter substrate-binding protein [Sulfolobaceae archaeon]